MQAIRNRQAPTAPDADHATRGTAVQIAGGLAGWLALMGYLFLLPGLLGQLMQPLMGA